MLWFTFLPMTHSYSIYSPSRHIWGVDNHRRPKWNQGFITNTSRKKLDACIAGYEQAAKVVGVKIRVEDEAYDIHGRIVASCVAIFIDDDNKRSSFWRALEEVKEPKTSFLIEGINKPEIVIAKCNCSITLLMRTGCKCNGL